MAVHDGAVTKVPADSAPGLYARFKERTGMARVAAVNAVDAASPVFAPFAAWWDTEAERRRQLRTPENLKALMAAQRANSSARSTSAAAKAQRATVRQASSFPWSRPRRAARAADRAARRNAQNAGQDLKAAHKNYPATLGQLAVRAHAVHAVPAGMVSYVWSTPDDWLMWPAGMSVSLVAANVAVLWLGRRTPAPGPVDESLSAEERRLLGRLDPAWWEEHAAEQGLERTLTERPQITPAGIVCGVRLDGKGRSAKWLASEADAVRRLLGMKTETRLEITSGTHGDRATITIRTRSAADGIDLEGWRPGDCWAVDTVTGEPLPVPLGKRMLIAGTSGAGKSYSARPLLAEASEHPDHRLVIFDRKHVEGRTWSHRARIVCELDDMREVCEELIEEGEERLKVLPRGKDVVEISPERPRITVFADEGGELLSDAKTKVKGEDGKTSDYQDIVETLRTIARKYRAAEIILVWATQKPTMSGDGHGIDSQIAGQMSVKLGLAVASQTDAQTVFGRSDWPAHDLPMPGYALLFDQDKGPKQRRNPIRLRFMTAQQVIDLPARPIWGRAIPASVIPAAPGSEDPTITIAAVPPAASESNRDRVIDAVRAGAVTVAEIAAKTSLNKGTVSSLLKKLRDAGVVERAADGAHYLTGATDECA